VTVGLIAHVIESHGIPTVVIGTAHDIMSQVRPPRAVFVDHPVGRTFGPPHDRQRHETILARALAELPHFTRRDMRFRLQLVARWQPRLGG
jgi:hypothetical protein